MRFDEVVDLVARAVDAVGVAIIVIGGVMALGPYLWRSLRGDRSLESFRTVRRNLGRAILLGLEFMVAGDIIKTVAIDPTLSNVGVLALIVLIRTFLSASLEVEIEGRWPWARATSGR